MSSLLNDWKVVKSSFEKTDSKKPAVMAMGGLWRKSSGLEPCFKKLDDLYEKQPVEDLETDFDKIASEIETIDMKQSKLSKRITKWLIWNGEVSEATKKLCVTAETYEKLCKGLGKEFTNDVYLRVLIRELGQLVLKAKKKRDSFKEYVGDYERMKSFVEQLSEIDTRAGKEVGLLKKAIKPIIKIKTKWTAPSELVWPSSAAKIREEAKTCHLKVESAIETRSAERRSGSFEKTYKSLLALAVKREALVADRPRCYVLDQ